VLVATSNFEESTGGLDKSVVGVLDVSAIYPFATPRWDPSNIERRGKGKERKKTSGECGMST
jgi:hypothetical protein